MCLICDRIDMIKKGTNTPLNKVIQNCGGILENKVKDSDNDIINRYWISISK